MNFLASYGDSDSDDTTSLNTSNKNSTNNKPQSPTKPSLKKQKINPAPTVDKQIEAYNFVDDDKADSKEMILHNVPYDKLYSTPSGPENPYSNLKSTKKNKLTGFVEEHVMTSESFKTMQRTFMKEGYAQNPDGTGSFVGDIQKAIENKGALVGENKAKKHAREKAGDPSDVDAFLGPWAKYEVQNSLKSREDDAQEELEPFTERPPPVPETKKKWHELVVTEEKTIFHGAVEHDYLGRSYMHIPNDLDIDIRGEPGLKESFLPKKCIHTWTGHSKGVNAIRFFPRYGHLLLSCSLDGSVKLWDAHHDRSLLRSYMGHSKSVKDIDFNYDGTKFISAGYDKWLKLWDTETGACITTFTVRQLPQCVGFNPDESRSHYFLCGCQDKKIYQFDINSGSIVRNYSQHLGAVNTINYIRDTQQIVTTSDDKSIRLWEFGVPVVVKNIADPEMNSMPAASMSMNNKFLAATAMDNKVLVFSTIGKFKQLKNKVLKGHLVSGYACKPSWSPDSRFICSGDSEGKVWFWDFKTGKVLKKFQAHNDVVIATEWNPQEQSKVATASWDGTIKYFD